MLTEFLAFINERKLFSSQDRLLLAVSGGLDSVVLTHLMRQAGFAYGIAHVNFQLRGDESIRDELFVQTLAEQQSVPFYLQRFDTLTIARQKGLSTQLAARTLRYEWFERLRTDQGYTYILTAHHLNDSLETVLLNLVRGTGLAGFRGIPAQTPTLVRPLLGFSREQLAAYAAEQGLTWVEDSSNQKDAYRRNRLRHQVVPVLQELNPNLLGTFRTTLDRMEAAERFIAQQLQSWQQQVARTHEISLSSLDAFPEPLFVLTETLKAYDFSYQQCQAIYQNRWAQPGTRYFSARYQLVLDRQCWLLEVRQTSPLSGYTLSELPAVINTPFFSLTLQRQENFSWEANPFIAYLDAAALIFPLTLRTWQSGDWFCPLGLGGKRQKVSDFLINQKIPRMEKDRIYVLECQGQIVWIVGKRIDERFKITEKTRTAVQVKMTLEPSFAETTFS